jgi:hypothetical protein
MQHLAEARPRLAALVTLGAGLGRKQRRASTHRAPHTVTTYTAYHSTAKKWHTVPASTKRCHTKWPYGIRSAAKKATPAV